MSWRIAAATVLTVLLLGGFAFGEEEQDKRLKKLERENQELRERVQRIEAGKSREKESLEEEVERYLRERVPEEASQEEEEEGIGLNLVVRHKNVQGIIQVFGDVGAVYSNPEMPGRGNFFFFNGSLDLFIRARFGDHFNILSETVFLVRRGEPMDTSTFTRMRLWGAWAFSDAFQVKLGQEHGQISRWNHIFHHGLWLQLTASRPFLTRFEGAGGILPMHNAGLEISGTVETPAGAINYVFVVSNGRGRVVTDKEEFSDRNNEKAFDFGINGDLSAIPGLWVGAVFRIDYIAPNPSNPARQGSIREYIVSLQIEYHGDKLEIIAEYAFMQNRDRQSSTNFDHHTGYFQLGFHLTDTLTPYTRFDFRNMATGDPYFSPVNRDLDIWEILFGVRYDIENNAALKIEVGYGEREQRNSTGGVFHRGYIRVAVQLAWVF